MISTKVLYLDHHIKRQMVKHISYIQSQLRRRLHFFSQDKLVEVEKVVRTKMMVASTKTSNILFILLIVGSSMVAVETLTMGSAIFRMKLMCRIRKVISF